ncbi:MAG: 23S rRNA (pseudouridine(1915)-N(3))-methyltransferase RlmH [Bacteroidales bacterium]|jgi:23S rRNA (pseudouridine1915-N3)-methyltransferase|nr:23S rRNA (pseudouridine(1915)-N(3))-methyltransferase RlmH [Bacteroidales bacterium]
MKIRFVLNGKTEEKHIDLGCQIYEKRIKRFVAFDQVVVPSPRLPSSAKPMHVKEKEAEVMEKVFLTDEYIMLLDEGGQEMTSVEFSDFLQQRMNSGIKSLCFIVGGPHGFADSIRQKSKGSLSLSKMTFPHQLVRLLFMEQLYRAFSILRNDPYHHA